MNTQETLREQFQLMYGTVARNLEGMNHEKSVAQAAHGGNCANWILGHLTNVQNGVMQLLNESPVWESDQLKLAGWEPITDRGRAIDWATLTSKFLGSQERCLNAISKLTDSALNDEVPHPFSGTTTRGSLLNILAFHQAYHSGQLGLARRGAGLEGAIKGPGQPAGARAS